MRICWRVIAVASISFSIGSVVLVAEATERQEPEIDIFASMEGKCSALKVAERDFACSSVAFFHTPGGRSSFAVPLNDPDDDSHIITFSGEKSKRERDNLYELSIDRVLLKSKDRPKVDGLPVPSVGYRREHAGRLEILQHSRCPACPVLPPMQAEGSMNSSSSRMAHRSRCRRSG